MATSKEKDSLIIRFVTLLFIVIYLLLGIDMVMILVSPNTPESSIDLRYLARKRRISYG